MEIRKEASPIMNAARGGEGFIRMALCGDAGQHEGRALRGDSRARVGGAAAAGGPHWGWGAGKQSLEREALFASTNGRAAKEGPPAKKGVEGTARGGTGLDCLRWGGGLGESERGVKTKQNGVSK